MKQVTISITVEREDPNNPGVFDEFDVDVTGDYTPGTPGTWYRPNGDPGDPPEGPEIEITAATDPDGREIELTDRERERAEEMIAEAGSEPDYDGPDYVE